MEFPPIHSFPPLYTRQPNKLVRNKQLETWAGIILDNAKKLHRWEIDKTGRFERGGPSIFTSESIGRAVPQLFINEIWRHMQRNNQIILRDESLQWGVLDDADADASFYVLWRPLDAWTSLILEWFDTANQMGKVVTFYELAQGDESLDCEFHGIPEPLLLRILKPLVKRGRATMLKGDNDQYVAIKVV
ncbi:ESCRT-II subunit protein VPS25 KNAG_0D01300 [Huiozyma naganishii CBS 8797]|uniref:ESCRT-II complex subunit VPS25 n=1 Tax=Huiozyma naganishii (strain ATCC MYA-139 / BCRC 22969 / CBS 8797 / KCTC 17520 / NBRC 10181 / NCYC 3082 / Yp74L-3) TaxID=1071383 RepID=J7RXQ3_HUIN7|nr:hypothetical protein KNAG_0D01300 [Kazachstania naganishii CBS 8797]CCK69882.1 hypothetical protein KNAG_0D01300 [Kazachstania naganishii CBS 8797]